MRREPLGWGRPDGRQRSQGRPLTTRSLRLAGGGWLWSVSGASERTVARMTGLQLRRLRAKGGTRMHRRSFNWVALVGIGLAGVVAVSAATALAARSAASPFELVVQGRAVDVILDGTFTSSAPFCESGTAAHAPHSGEYRELYTCSDGSGSLTFRFMPLGDSGDWTIVEGSGRYASLRGKGNTSSRTWGPWRGRPGSFARSSKASSTGVPSRISPRTPIRSGRRSPSPPRGPRSSVARRAPTRSRSPWHSATTSRGTASRTC